MNERELLSGVDAAIALKLAQFRQIPSVEQRLFFELGFIAGLEHQMGQQLEKIDAAIEKLTEGS